VINNLYGMGTSDEMASGEPDLYKRAAAYRMHGERIDGNDVLAVREAAARLLERARGERKPALLETVTYRYRGHSVADAGKNYRTREEIEEHRKQDPIQRYAAVLKEAGILDDDDIEAIRREVNEEVAEAIREAAGAPSPDPDELYDKVYGDPDTAEQFSRMNTAAPYGERKGTREWRT
jgi:pyruvate dehydrogenase E1 component alpha subunit